MMTEIKCGAVLMAAAHKQGVEMNHDDATVVLSYMGIMDKYLLCSPDLSGLTLRHYTGGGKFPDTPCNILGAVRYAVEVCKSLLDYTLETKERGYTQDARYYRKEMKTLKRLAATYATALS